MKKITQSIAIIAFISFLSACGGGNSSDDGNNLPNDSGSNLSNGGGNTSSDGGNNSSNDAGSNLSNGGNNNSSSDAGNNSSNGSGSNPSSDTGNNLSNGGNNNSSSDAGNNLSNGGNNNSSGDAGNNSSNGGSNSFSDGDVKTGQFKDSAVKGLVYETATQSGITDEKGTFKYKAGETVTFKIGEMKIGSAKGKSVLYPTHITDNKAKAIKIAQVLQTLDKDKDPKKGINIEGQFNANSTKNEKIQEVNLQALIDNIKKTPGSLVDADKAEKHMDETIAYDKHPAFESVSNQKDIGSRISIDNGRLKLSPQTSESVWLLAKNATAITSLSMDVKFNSGATYLGPVLELRQANKIHYFRIGIVHTGSPCPPDAGICVDVVVNRVAVNSLYLGELSTQHTFSGIASYADDAPEYTASPLAKNKDLYMVYDYKIDPSTPFLANFTIAFDKNNKKVVVKYGNDSGHFDISNLFSDFNQVQSKFFINMHNSIRPSFVDNVKINNQDFDDFSATTLNTNKWKIGKFSYGGNNSSSDAGNNSSNDGNNNSSSDAGNNSSNDGNNNSSGNAGNNPSNGNDGNLVGVGDIKTGQFKDSAVKGLVYETATQHGITDEKGTFKYKAGETVTFKIGAMIIGSAKGKSILYPTDLTDNKAKAIKIAQVLQTLDKDKDSENGIDIEGQFDLNSTKNKNIQQINLQVLIDGIAKTPSLLVDADKAEKHMNETISTDAYTTFESISNQADIGSHVSIDNGRLRLDPQEKTIVWLLPKNATAITSLSMDVKFNPGIHSYLGPVLELKQANKVHYFRIAILHSANMCSLEAPEFISCIPETGSQVGVSSRYLGGLLERHTFSSTLSHDIPNYTANPLVEEKTLYSKQYVDPSEFLEGFPHHALAAAPFSVNLTIAFDKNNKRVVVKHGNESGYFDISNLFSDFNQVQSKIFISMHNDNRTWHSLKKPDFVDNVKINNQDFDDFSATTLDTNKWKIGKFSYVGF